MAALFNKQAEKYAATRPSYPDELFDFIASKTPRHDLVWDVGTGSGQAAVHVGINPSISLISNLFFYWVVEGGKRGGGGCQILNFQSFLSL